MDKVFETKERNQAILDMTRKLWYPLCVTFDHYCQTSISEREIGHKSAPYSEIYQFFICLATPEATCAFFYTTYQILHQLWQVESFLK